MQRLKDFANMRNSAWKLAAEEDQTKGHDIKTIEDFRLFLLAIQRVPENSLIFTARCRQPR